MKTKKSHSSALFSIGKLAKKARITVETIRFYEKKGLISANLRSENGYRLYSDTEAQRLYFILHAKKVGFSLQEISHLLSLQINKDQHTCEEVKNYTQDKINEVTQKIIDLEKIQYALKRLNRACCGGSESAINCSILHTLEDPNYFQQTTKENKV